MNKHNVYDRLNLYNAINNQTNKLINNKTSINVLLRHIYYKSKSTEIQSYAGPIAFTFDITHLVCNIFINLYKSSIIKK